MSLETLNTRLNYHGANIKERMESDKLRSLRAALKRSYQRQTAILQDGREFFCLINPEKLKNDYDEKMISIPFEDICLNAPRIGKTTQGRVPIGMKDGDTFEWKEDGSHWICYLRRKQETAYYKAIIRQCDYEVEMESGNRYWIYFKGPSQQDIEWHSKDNIVWNNLNYTAMFTITRNEETLEFFHRFAKVKIDGKNWEVAAVDSMSTEGIIDVYLNEDFTNSIQDAVDEMEANKPPQSETPEDWPAIVGDLEVYPYDIKSYSIKNAMDGTWEVNTNKVRILSQTDSIVKLEIVTGKSGIFQLIYKREDEDDIIQDIKILSL